VRHRLRIGRHGLARCELELEAGVLDHLVIGVRRRAAGRQVALREDRVRRVERERLQRAQRDLATTGDAEVRARMHEAEHAQRAQRVRRLDERIARERRTRRQVLSVVEEQMLLPAAKGHLHAMIIAALDTGMRRGEITSQRWEDVDFTRKLLFVTRSKTPEGESREIPLTERLLKYLLQNRQSKGLIVSYKDEPVRIVKRSWKTALKNAKLRHVRFHDLRHTFNTRLMEAGVLQEVRIIEAPNRPDVAAADPALVWAGSTVAESGTGSGPPCVPSQRTSCATRWSLVIVACTAPRASGKLSFHAWQRRTYASAPATRRCVPVSSYTTFGCSVARRRSQSPTLNASTNSVATAVASRNFACVVAMIPSCSVGTPNSP